MNKFSVLKFFVGPLFLIVTSIAAQADLPPANLNVSPSRGYETGCYRSTSKAKQKIQSIIDDEIEENGQVWIEYVEYSNCTGHGGFLGLGHGYSGVRGRMRLETILD